MVFAGESNFLAAKKENSQRRLSCVSTLTEWQPASQQIAQSVHDSKAASIRVKPSPKKKCPSQNRGKTNPKIFGTLTCQVAKKKIFFPVRILPDLRFVILPKWINCRLKTSPMSPQNTGEKNGKDSVKYGKSPFIRDAWTRVNLGKSRRRKFPRQSSPSYRTKSAASIISWLIPGRKPGNATSKNTATFSWLFSRRITEDSCRINAPRVLDQDFCNRTR